MVQPRATPWPIHATCSRCGARVRARIGSSTGAVYVKHHNRLEVGGRCDGSLVFNHTVVS